MTPQPSATFSDEEVRSLYPYRRTRGLTPEQIAEIERRHAAMVGQPWQADSSPTDLDPVDAAAVDIPDDPDTGAKQDAGLYANLPLPNDEDTGMRQDAGIYANLPPENVDTSAREAELVRRGMDPAMARTVAQAEVKDPRDPMSSNPTPLGVRAAIAEENARRAAQPTPISDRERQFNSEVAESDRQMANIRRLIRAGVNPAQDMTAPDAESDRQWRDWTTGGSLDRMAQYAPDEFERRHKAAADQRWKENRQAYQNRWDQTIDERTGKSKGELYRMAQNAEDKEMLARTAPQANRALARQLEQMGIDSKQFGDWRSDSFAREGALDAKNRAMASGTLGGRYGEVQKRAMLRQNPMAYMGRDDVDAEQKAMLSALMLGRGATPNDIKALQAKMFLEGLQEGQRQVARQNININPGVQEAQAAMAMEQIAGQREARRRPDEDVLGEKYAPTGYFGYDEFTVDEQQSMYDDLVAQGYTPADAQRAVDRQATKRRATNRASWRDAGGK